MEAENGIKEYARPHFDKTAYRKTVWSQANAWFPLNLSRTHGRGPTHFWWNLSADERTMWRQVAEKLKPYGLTGLQMDMSMLDDGTLSWENVFNAALDGFRQADNGFFLVPMFNRTPKTSEMAIKALEEIIPLLKNHPNAYRLNGSPVIVIYYTKGFSPEEWLKVIETVEEKHGRMIWLMNTWWASQGFGHPTPELLRDYLRVFDGVTQYGSWDEELRQRHLTLVSSAMKEFPEKIFELMVHHTLFVHYYGWGYDPVMTRKFREEWEEAFGFNPDSVVMSNLNDLNEYSFIFPSHEAEDIIMKFVQYYTTRWRGEEFPSIERTDIPDLYVTNPTNVMLGQTLTLDVIGFPVKGTDRNVTIYLELCDEKENVLHAFPARKIVLDSMRVEQYDMPSEEFYYRRAILPRLRYEWRGKEGVSYLFPHTNLVTSIRPHILFWARSLNRTITIGNSRNWSIEGAGQGDTLLYPEMGTGVITSNAIPKERPLPNYLRKVPDYDGDHGLVRIMRNGREIESWGDWRGFRYDLHFNKIIRLPNPGDALDWYNIELENLYGNYDGVRYLSPPVWVVSGRRQGNVKLPILLASGEVKDVEVESVRVPYFQYDCDRETGGRILLDVSGHDHHGYLGGEGYGGGNFSHVGYRFEHIPLTGVRPDMEKEYIPQYRKDADGTGYLDFNGKSYVMIQGGTAFPYASTYELYVKPEKIGERQAIIGTANNSVNLYLTEDGRIEATRLGMTEAVQWKETTVGILSKKGIQPKIWTHIAVTYDLKELKLYVNGILEDSVEVKSSTEKTPHTGLERSHAVVIGGTVARPFIHKSSFVGGVRNIRIYGRNLGPEEFLINQ